MDVLATTDPAEVLRRADALLATDPVRTNVVGTLLRQRVASGDAAATGWPGPTTRSASGSSRR